MRRRVAVTLPSLEPGSCHRLQLDAAIDALAGQDLELECFAEDSRLREPEALLPRWHYLRLPERHAVRPFDAALYPLGRDYRPYEPSWIALHQMPATVWVLDPVLHHLVVGGMVLRGRWDAYRAAMVKAFGAAAPVLTDVLSSWWTTSSFYARHDPVPALLAGQRSVLASSSAIADAWSGPALAGTVALPSLPAACERTPRQGLRRLAVLTLNLVRPEPVLLGLRTALAADPELSITVAAPQLVHEHRLAPACDQLGGLDRLEWLIGTDWLAMRELVTGSDAVAFLRRDPTTAEDALLRWSLAAGKVGIVLDTAAFADYPGHAVAKTSPGSELSSWLPGLLERLRTDGDLVAALAREGRRFENARADAQTVAAALAEQLTAGSPEGGLQLRDLAASARVQLGARLEDLMPNSNVGRARTTATMQKALGRRWYPDQAQP